MTRLQPSDFSDLQPRPRRDAPPSRGRVLWAAVGVISGLAGVIVADQTGDVRAVAFLLLLCVVSALFIYQDGDS